MGIYIFYLDIQINMHTIQHILVYVQLYITDVIRCYIGPSESVQMFYLNTPIYR